MVFFWKRGQSRTGGQLSQKGNPMRSTSTGVAGLFALLTLITAVHAQPRTPREALRENHPEVLFWEVGGRTRIVYGVPMTAGETPAAAAEAWLALYGEIFIDGREVGGPDLRLFSTAHTLSGKTILAYTQQIDGVPVEGSSARVMTVQDGEHWRVVYASTRVARRPVGGLPDPEIAALTALRTAQEHENGRSLGTWDAPTLVAVYEDGPEAAGDARCAWKCIGSGADDARAFYVDAATGAMLAHDSLVSHANADITGTITGKKSPGVKPDRSDCSYSHATEALPLIKVEGRVGGSLVDSAFTDEDGDYVLDIDSGPDVTVKASLEWAGEAWRIINVNGDDFVPCPTATTNPVEASTVVTPPNTGVNLTLNNSPSQFATAQVNVAHGLWKTRDYVRDRVAANSLPLAGLDDVVEAFVNVSSGNGTCNARYISNCYGCNSNQPCLTFSPNESTCANTAYATWIAHEYGHYLLDIMRGISNNTDRKPFHEGWSDALAFLAYNVEKFGEDFLLANCSNQERAPLLFSPTPTFPFCRSDEYERSKLLSALWLDLKNSSLGLATTRQLHVDWMLMAEWPNVTGCTPTARHQSAAESTLLEVLEVDDNDGNLNNGTPNITAICDVFDARGISTLVCITTLTGRCRADCDHSTGTGVLDVFDYLCFQNRYSDGDPWACNCDTSTGAGVCDVFDFLCFQEAFAGGCP